MAKYKLLKYKKIKNEEIKQQETTAQCAICIVMRYAYKWMLAAGILSMIMLLIAVVLSWCITGNDEPGRWAYMWLLVTILELIVSGLAAIATNWRDVKDFMRDAMRCA